REEGPGRKRTCVRDSAGRRPPRGQALEWPKSPISWPKHCGGLPRPPVSQPAPGAALPVGLLVSVVDPFVPARSEGASSGRGTRSTLRPRQCPRVKAATRVKGRGDRHKTVRALLSRWALVREQPRSLRKVAQDHPCEGGDVARCLLHRESAALGPPLTYESHHSDQRVRVDWRDLRVVAGLLERGREDVTD